MRHVIIRLPKTITYGDDQTKQLHQYNEFITGEDRFQANGFDLDEDDFDTYGLRTVDGNRVSVFPASFHDEYNDLGRGPQIMMRKDVGHIITTAGITDESTVLDAGSGSGALAIYLARVSGHVDTYDVDEDNVALTAKNAEALNADRLTTQTGDITDPEVLERHDYDVFTLDIPEPWRAIKTAMNALTLGGYLVTYTPQITQAQRIVTETPEALNHERTVDVTVDEWDVDEDILRPATKGLKHTGFLSYFRFLDE